jgi:undecaprenyl-diphosphatase
MSVLDTLRQAELRLFTRLFSQGRRRMVVPAARAISHSGDGYLHALMPLLVWLSGSEQAGVLASLLAVALIVERAVYWSLKNSLKRRRPQDSVPGFRSLITASDQFSFPSGHSSGAFLLATACTVAFGAPIVAVYLWAAAVALSRVILGVHFPGDTVAGALMGTIITLGCASWLGAF